MEDSAAVGQIRFGSFELYPRTGELLKEGIPLKLPAQPFRVLLLLASRPRELVTREEIKDAVWTDGTTVEFDPGLNFCIRQIRAALKDDARQPKFIETLPKRGYRFIAPVEVASSYETGYRNQAASPPAPQSRRYLRWWFAAASAAILLLTVSLSGLLHAGPKSILVRPFVSLNLPQEDAWFADVIPQQLVASLAETKSLRIVPWAYSMALNNQTLGARELGARFHVDTILEGSLRRSGDRLQLTMQLVDVATERTLWSFQDERDVRDLGYLRDDLLAAIEGALKLRIAEDAVPAARRPPQDRETYNLYLKALYLADEFSPERVAQGVNDFEEVIRRAPGYAPAYAGLANSLTILPFVEAAPPKDTLARATSAARQAINLDFGLAAAHAALAHSYFNEWDWGSAAKEFQIALNLDPDSATTRQLHALFLASQGRGDEAIREARRAVDLAPTSWLISLSLSQVFLQSGHFDDAIEQARRTLDLYPNFSEAYTNLARAYSMKGRYSEAIETLRQWAYYEPRAGSVQQLWRAQTLARAGQNAEARALILTWRKESVSRRKGFPMAYVASLLACGDTDGALKALRQSVERHTPSMIWLKTTPELAAIRSDRRFVQVLAQMNLD